MEVTHMEENARKSNAETTAIHQPSFEVRNFRENRPTYAIGGALKWKNKPKKKKTYPVVDISKVRIREGGFVVREDVLVQSKELYKEIKELIPVALDIRNVLVNGYEQYLIAKEEGHKTITYVPVKISKTEQRKRHKKNKETEKKQHYNMRKAQRKKKEKTCK